MIEAYLVGARQCDAPFPHFQVPAILSREAGEKILDWFDRDAPWCLKLTDFYEQHEFSLLHCKLPPPLESLVSTDFIDTLASEIGQRLGGTALEIVDVVAHRMVAGQTVRLHNDYLGGEETHRCVIQVNRGWSPEQGGYLMLFGDDNPESVTDVLPPIHLSALAFAISDRSHHAVSTVHKGRRDTIVYTYRRQKA